MPTLLVADDDAVDRESAARCVASIENLELLEAADGRQALELCARSTPDLVLTDLRMPQLDGLTLVKEMRQRFPQVPVILMTARGSEQIALQALAAGAVSYVPKADMFTVLGESIEHALGVLAARREQVELMAYLKSSALHFELINDPALITPLVAHLQKELEHVAFADEQTRSQIGTVLYEALSNAMIHGNLEVGSELREEGTESYHRLIEKRRASEPWSHRRLFCQADHRPDRVEYLIRDQGSGFDRTKLPDPTRPENMLKARGRGLFLMSALMDEVEFNEAGNEVRLTKRRIR